MFNYVEMAYNLIKKGLMNIEDVKDENVKKEVIKKLEED